MNNVRYGSAAFYSNMLSRQKGLTELYTYDTGGEYGLEFGWHCNYFGESGYRLLSKAEWTYAYKGGKNSQGYEYSGSDTYDEVGWSWEYSAEPRHAVGGKTANELGIHDMTGNIAELNCDHFGYWTDDYYVDPTGVSYDQLNPYTVFIDGWGSVLTDHEDDQNGFRVIKYEYSEPNHNMKPSCEITNPSNSSGSFDQGDVIKVAVEARDEDGTVEEVKIYFDDVLIGSAEVSSFYGTYQYHFLYLETDGVTQGEHFIKAVAIDNEGGERIDEHRTYFTDEVNTSPTAVFTMSENEISIDGTVDFDASGCSDNENEMRFLEISWDFDGDGVYDTYYNGYANEITTYQFYEDDYAPGTYTITMKVKDRGGRTDTVAHDLIITSK